MVRSGGGKMSGRGAGGEIDGDIVENEMREYFDMRWEDGLIEYISLTGCIRINYN